MGIPKTHRARRIRKKLQLVIQAGGKCQACGYNKNLSSLVFHHKENKVISLAGHNLASNNSKVIDEEFMKCILLCSNCHNELHNPSLNTKNVIKFNSAIESKAMTPKQAEAYFLKEEDGRTQ